MEFLTSLFDFFARMFEFLSFSKRPPALGVYVKETSGRTVFVELDPRWDIKNVKDLVAKKLGVAAEDLKIIFAGKELQENVMIKVSGCGNIFAYSLTTISPVLGVRSGPEERLARC